MPTDTLIDWKTIAQITTVTNLNSLADGNIWQSGEINDADPGHTYLKIWYKLVFNTTPVAGDSLIFWIGEGDGEASEEIWEGGIGTSESEISAAASIAEVEQALTIAHTHPWNTDHGATFKGSFIWSLPHTSWQLLIQADGEALASSGHLLRYQYGTPQAQ